MTRKEAAHILRIHKPARGTKERMEAFDMAVSALEQPECEDAVSRQEAIKAIESVPDGNWRNVRYSNELRKLPSVTPKRGEA